MNRIELILGDITKLETDAIVNAANSALAGGGGVDGAIHRAGGKVIADQCRAIRDKQGGCLTGEAVITAGGNLKAKYVIHTVGPVWNGGNDGEDKLLANSYRNSLRLATNNKIQTIAFPNISTGIYGFPKERAAQIAIGEVQNFLKDNPSIQKVIFCCFDNENYKIYHSLLNS
jgi:O-acetyl-ADP-ribose deacetylase